jgi:hypothetical protein
MIYHIRPHKLFHLITTQNMADRLVSVILPSKYSPMTFGTTLLIAITKIAQPLKYFEFGTYLGIQTLTIAANFPETFIYTLDMNKNDFTETEHTVNQHDKKLILRSIEHRDKTAFSDTPYEKRIVQLYGDSNKYNFSKLYGLMNMVYIDGGHDRKTLLSDTKNALCMISDEAYNCIVWHDYTNPNHPQVTQYLEDFSVDKTFDLFHVEESTFCFAFPNAPPSLNTKFLE